MISTINFDKRGRREELATTLTFGTGKVAKEVFVNLSERIPFGINREICEKFFNNDTRMESSILV